ncbi:MAG: hypothetical protein IPP48_15480 [Chitinophagaceae bacterium]|nr:hypothetical protein [Chitinophagaceae bacterium]
MKSITLMLMGFFMCATSMAQIDANYTGPGKIYIKSFWSQAEILKNGKGSALTVGNMKRALDNAKEKDPALNTATMDAELKKWQAELDKKLDAEKSPEQKAADAKSGDYTGAAKNQVKYFWDRALQPTNKLSDGELNGNIRDMEYALKATKEKDPAYNASEMESALKKIKDDLKEKKLAEVRNTNGDRTKAPQQDATVSNDPVKLMEKLFIDAKISVGSTSDLPDAPAKIAAYKAKLEKLLSMDYTDALIKTGRNAKGNISGFKSSTEREMDKIEGTLKDARDKSNMEYRYYTIQFHQTFWDAAQKVFPEESSYAEMYKKTTAAFTGMGSLEQLYTKAEANRIEHIKNTKFPVAAVKDASLEKVLTNGFNKLYGATHSVSALKAVLTQNGWTTLRNSLTGIVVGRERSAKLAYKGSDGKCYLLPDYLFIREDYVGGSFINTVAVFNGLDGEEMLCENVK